MQPRIDYRKFAQQPLKPLLEIEKYLTQCGLEHKLLHLIKMRASQINGCAYCLDMHSLDARAAGETEQRLYTLDAWAETPFFTDRERAALADLGERSRTGSGYSAEQGTRPQTIGN